MEVVGTFTLLYYLITSLFQKLPDLWKLFLELPFILQETILVIACLFILPKVIDGIDKLIAKKHELDDKL